MFHESRFNIELRALMHSTRVAALGTIDDDGKPFVSMVPYALVPALGYLFIHVSGLAAHTGNLKARPKVALLVMQSEVPGEPVHPLPRVTFEGEAEVLEPNSLAWEGCRAAYLERFPDAEFMTQLGDFMFVAIKVTSARQIAGFGAARLIDEKEVRLALGPAQQVR